MEGSGRLPGASLKEPGDRITVNIFGNTTAIATALGLDVDLPDVENPDPAYWEAIRRNGGYKRRIADRIADPWLVGDDDWAKLLQLSWGEIWLDLEEGIKLILMSRNLSDALSLVADLGQRGVPLVGEEGESLVWVIPDMPTDDVLARIGPELDAAGLRHETSQTIWTLPARASC